MSIKSVIYDEGEYRTFMGKAEFDKALATMAGIIQGISCDGVINEKENIEITNWITLHEHLSKYQPFTELVPAAKAALADGVIDSEELQDLIWIIQQFDEGGKYYDINTLAMQVLHGIFHGVLSDGIINDLEIEGLQKWIGENQILKGTYPFDELESIINGILADGVVTDQERKQLKAFMGEFIDITSSYNLTANEFEILKNECQIEGLCSYCPEVIFKNHAFCFTGKSSRSTRSEIENVVIQNEGFFNENVVKGTNYLVIGNEGNSCWAFCCYGRKVEKAMQMRKSGVPIILVHENDFWDAL